MLHLFSSSKAVQSVRQCTYRKEQEFPYTLHICDWPRNLKLHLQSIFRIKMLNKNLPFPYYMNYKNRELPILTYFKKKAILRKNMTAFRILSILKYIYAYVFLSIHVGYFGRDKTLE